MILTFDCETTGKADMRGPLDGKHQPHIVQLAALLIDDDQREVMQMNVIIRPEGWTIPEDASAIHGITTEYAEKVGVYIEDALYTFSGMKRAATSYVAHNIEFDKFMVASEVTRQKNMTWKDESMSPEKCFCTMKAMTEICQLPGPYGFKWPKLQEAHKHCFGEEFDGAHDALSDVRAAARIYFWLQKWNMPPVMVDEGSEFTS